MTSSPDNTTLSPLKGEITVPSDKSITHRAILFSAIAHGDSLIRVATPGRDNLASVRVMQQLGVRIKARLDKDSFAMSASENLQNSTCSENSWSEFEICGRGVDSLKNPSGVLYCGNSGTTARLLTGILAGSSVQAVLDGDESLRRRPFRRVTEPLAQMGAVFDAEHLPLTVQGASGKGGVKGISHSSLKASAQVKSAILLAGLQSFEPVKVCEPIESRNHTELMFRAMQVHVQSQQDDSRWTVSLPPASPGHKRLLQSVSEMTVPGDFSSAAFFLVAGALVPGSSVCVRSVGVNPTRVGLLGILERMGAKIATKKSWFEGLEPIEDLSVRGSNLRGVDVSPKDVVLAIDEIPILAIAAAFADGVTHIRGAEELRVKESDRLGVMSALLSAYGFKVVEYPDGMSITGDKERIGKPEDFFRQSGQWDASGDHRIQMSHAVLQYVLSGGYELTEQEAVETSFPSFNRCFSALCGESN